MEYSNLEKILIRFLLEHSGKYTQLEITKILIGAEEFSQIKDIVDFYNYYPKKDKIYFSIKKLVETNIENENFIKDKDNKLFLKSIYIRKKKREEFFIKLFDYLEEKYKFEGFVHTTNFDNFVQIMKKEFIYSRSELNRQQIQNTEIALQDIINKTPSDIMEYVRFYWRAKTPTNFKNEGIKPSRVLNFFDWSAHSPIPVIIIFDKNIALHNDVKFTNGNASSKYTLITEDLSSNSKYFSWANIFHEGIINNLNYTREITNNKNAELLYPTKISTQYIKKIIFRTEIDKLNAEQILGKDKRFVVDNNNFYNNFLYVKDIGEYFIKFSIKLSEYTHTLKIFKGEKLINIVFLNKFINDSNHFSQTYPLKDLNDFDYICYNIDDIECFRIYNDSLF